MIRIEHLHKSFGRFKIFNDISLRLPAQKIIALLGPNGSGKTTLLKTILGIVHPDKGDIWVMEKKIQGNYQYRTHINYLPQIARFPDNLSARELITLIQDIRNDTPSIHPLQEMLLLDEHMDKRLKHLSGGTRQKINILLACMFDSPIYFMDEPTAGLDPIALVRIKEYLQQLAKQGKSILFSTHMISLVEELAQEVIFLLEGKVFFQGSLAELKQLGKEDRLEKAIAHILLRS